MLIVGTEWVVDAEGCRAEALADVRALAEVFRRVVAELDLRVVGEARWQKFAGPGGVTGLALLTESHLACHTYPEFGVATFNLYCCRARPRWPWEERLAEMLGAARVTVRVVERRAAGTKDAPAPSFDAEANTSPAAEAVSSTPDSSARTGGAL